MGHVIRANHEQRFLLPPSLDDWVAADHPVRFVRDFVEQLELKELGFKQLAATEGRPPYAPELLLSVWLFGWMERVRSSRALEKACRRDVAFLWLTGNHHPDHNTIWRFFKDNRPSLKKLFKKVVQVAVKAELVGFALHALDGTKIAAASSMDTALHREKLDKKLKRLDDLIEQQMKEAEAAEAGETDGYVMPKEMQDTKVRREKIKESLQQLDEAETNHLHPTDPEARVMRTRTHNTLAYNAQAVVDAKSDLIVGFDVVSDETDAHQLTAMLDLTAETAGRVADETVADKGYDTGEEIARAEEQQRPVLVTLREEAETKGDYRKSCFQYDGERDCYVCPRGQLLQLTGRRKPTKAKPYVTTIYRCHDKTCPVRSECTSDVKGRAIKRTPFEDAIARQRKKQEQADKRAALDRRGAIVEHVFGLIKQRDGFRRFTVRGLDKVRAQFALLAAAFNLRKLVPHWRSGALVLAA